MAALNIKNTLLSAQFLIFLTLTGLVLLPLTFPVSLPGLFWVDQAINMCLWSLIFYLNFKLLVPKLLFAGHTALFIAAIIVIVLIVLGLGYLLDKIFHLHELIEQRLTETTAKPPALPSLDFGLIVISLVVVGLSTIAAVGEKLRKDQSRLQESEKEIVTAELQYLKTQLNPHFFFNVLHTIYALTAADSQKAQEAIYTLSKMMRYVLYETKGNLTTLEKEVSFIEDYVKLMQLRLTERTQLIIDRSENLPDARIAPMLLLPLVENAFKHGISSIYPSYIYIGIKRAGDFLDAEIRNSIFLDNPGDPDEGSGIGLLNTQRRLNLLYPDSHSLTIRKDDHAQEYTVKLKLKLWT